MYCNNCGKENPKKSKFCQHCGVEIVEADRDNEAKLQREELDTEKFIDQQTPPYPYVISNWKLLIMSISTLGVYLIYWFYRQWKSFNEVNKLNHGKFTLFILAWISGISSFYLFGHISKNLKAKNDGKGLESGILGILYLVLSQAWLGFLPLMYVQNKINLYWEKSLGKKLVRSSFGLGNWVVLIIFVLIVALAYFSDTETGTSDNSSFDATYSQEEIVSSVVNIFCPSTLGDEYSMGGSGTIITEDGYILTNSHIIPQDEEYHYVQDGGCIVTIPDPSTGQILEVYYAEPIVLPGASDTYDLAYLKINRAAYDEETAQWWGTYPNTFHALRCQNGEVELGQPVRIFGYPGISGEGLSLTITDGVVSSIPGDGTIITSAKINHGNSGGLAVDKNGCMIGVPTAFQADEAGSLGVIYSTELIKEFQNQIEGYPELSN